jgi:FtsZ-binding cell division protein ZapB
MALDRLDALENRIKDLVKLIQELKRRNASLEEEVKAARHQLASQDDANRRWEEERINIKSRIERVIGEIEMLECADDVKEVALD